MLFVIVIMFVVSWLPLQTFSMIIFLYPEIRENVEYQSRKYTYFIITYFVSHWLSMAHSCLNPLIYCFMNDKFRTDLHNLICRLRPRRATCLSEAHLVVKVGGPARRCLPLDAPQPIGGAAIELVRTTGGAQGQCAHPNEASCRSPEACRVEPSNKAGSVDVTASV